MSKNELVLKLNSSLSSYKLTDIDNLTQLDI